MKNKWVRVQIVENVYVGNGENFLYFRPGSR